MDSPFMYCQKRKVVTVFLQKALSYYYILTTKNAIIKTNLSLLICLSQSGQKVFEFAFEFNLNNNIARKPVLPTFWPSTNISIIQNFKNVMKL